MVKEKIDLRVVKTRKAIKESFIRLIQTKSYERITVQDIADEALINRNTFYLHYLDKPDLMDKLCMETAEKLNVCVDLEIDDIREADPAVWTSLLKNLFAVIEENLVYFKTMLNQSGQSTFLIYLTQALRNIVLAGFKDRPLDLKTKVGLEYAISGLAGVIYLWVTEPVLVPIDEMIQPIQEIHFGHIVNIFENAKKPTFI